MAVISSQNKNKSLRKEDFVPSIQSKQWNSSTKEITKNQYHGTVFLKKILDSFFLLQMRKLSDRGAKFLSQVPKNMWKLI